MRARTSLLAGTALAGALFVSSVAPGVAGAAPAPVAPSPRSAPNPAVALSVDWLVAQQQADGGFEVAGFPGFETPDATLALAMAGQTTDTWSAAEALAAVQAVSTDGGKDPLDSLDDWIDGVLADGSASAASKAQTAAKLIYLVTDPLGLDATDFDPSGDSPAAVDLVATLQAAAGDGTYPSLPFTGRVYANLALQTGGLGDVDALQLAIIAGQQANGSWSFTGDPTGTGIDPDTTAVAMRGLNTPGDEGLGAKVRSNRALGLSQTWDGEWAGEFDDGNPNSTATVVVGYAALGADPDDPCYRDRVESRLAGVPYPSPVRALVARQQPDGRIASPSDGFGVNTFATSQAIQGLMAAADRSPFSNISPCTPLSVSANQRVVQAQFVDLLVRLGDQGGIGYWTQQMDSGLSGGFLAKRFTGTPEYGQRVVTRLVRTYLGRAATPQEQTAGAGPVVAGRRLDVAAGILGSQEYYDGTAPVFPSGPATDETWIAAVYPDTVGRAASAGDVAFVEGQLEAGLTRTQIARRLLGSVEGRSVTVQDIYRQLLRRNPSAADRAYWGELLRTGTSPERLVTLIAGSAEYRSLTAAPVE